MYGLSLRSISSNASMLSVNPGGASDGLYASRSSNISLQSLSSNVSMTAGGPGDWHMVQTGMHPPMRLQTCRYIPHRRMLLCGLYRISTHPKHTHMLLVRKHPRNIWPSVRRLFFLISCLFSDVTQHPNLVLSQTLVPVGYSSPPSPGCVFYL